MGNVGRDSQICHPVGGQQWCTKGVQFGQFGEKRSLNRQDFAEPCFVATVHPLLTSVKYVQITRYWLADL